MKQYRNLKSYGFRKYELHIRKMTVAELKVAALKDITEEKYTNARISVMDITGGTSDWYKNIDEFVKSDLNEGMEIELLNVGLNLIYNEEIRASEWIYIFVIK